MPGSAANAEVTNLSHIRMRIGRRRRSWVRNCVAVGLSGGFVEPLESTGLALIDMAQEQLVSQLAGGAFSDAGRDQFNANLGDLYEGIRDFLSLHFVTATRRDTDYWRHVTTDVAMVPPRVAEVLERWARGLAPLAAPGPFHPGSWMYILDGNQRRPTRPPDTRVRVNPSDDIAAAFRRAERQLLAGKLPSLRDWLAHARARFDAGESEQTLPDPDTLWDRAASRSFARPRRAPAAQ